MDGGPGIIPQKTSGLTQHLEFVIVNKTDVIVLACMAGAAAVAAVAFASITKYLFDRALADRHHPSPNVAVFYRTYMAHTRKTTGRIGLAFWVHVVFAGAFIAIGVAYTILRLVLPLFI